MFRTHDLNLIIALSITALTLVYGTFEARTLMRGPILTVSEPSPGATITDPLMVISGTAEHVTRIKVNGRPVALDHTGAFTEKLVTPEGYGKVLIEAENRFGKTARTVVEIVGRPEADDAPTLSARTVR